jgi:cation diffusion facilitator family transporter
MFGPVRRTALTGPSLTRFAWLSIAAAVTTIGLKAGAYIITGSVGLMSDAMESLVNLVAAIGALIALTVAEREPDEEHAFGFEKVEYFSSGLEGGLILIAAGGIGVAAVQRLLDPQALGQLGWGLAVSAIASAVNLAVAWRLLGAAHDYDSLVLEADARHLFTDVWTTAGVILGVGLVALTGWDRLDPIVALVVAGNIVWTGIGLVRRSTRGLLDAAVPIEERNGITAILNRYTDAYPIEWHAFRTRQAGRRRFVSVHILVPGDWTVHRGHELLEAIEGEICALLPRASLFTHLEPREDPASYEDTTLDRVGTR